MSKLDRLRELSLLDLVMLVQLTALSAAIALALRCLGWQRVSRAMTSKSGVSWLRRFPWFHLQYSIEAIEPLVEMASSMFPRNRCLVRSMTLLWLLRARGESAEVVLGVRKVAGRFESHAWTISERRLIGDRPEAIAQFQVIASSGEPERT
jgi:hypothetical protein